MKRFFFSLIALAAVATGCTQSAMLETPDLFNTPVSFSPYTGRTPETKATQITTADALATAGGFYVYGFLNQEGKEQSVYIDDEKVIKGTSGWTYNNVVYWPDASSTSTLDFVAYSANANDKTSKHNGLSNVSKDGFTFTVPDAIDNQVDLLATAYQSGNTLENNSTGNVTLQFHHLLSRVGFQVQQTNANKKLIVNSITFKGNMPNKGTLTFNPDPATDTPTLVPVAEAEGYSEKTYTYYSSTNGSTPIIGTSASKISGMESKYLMIMPHPVLEPDHSVVVNYTITDTEGNVLSANREASVVLPMGFEFQTGYAYEIILKISTSSISFDITEEDWNTTDKEIGPLEPDVEEEDIEEGEEYPTQLGMIISLGDIGQTTAKINLELTQDVSSSTVDEVGIAYRKVGESWSTDNIEEAGTDIGIYEFVIENLVPNTTYEICAYSAYLVMEGMFWNWYTDYTYYADDQGYTGGTVIFTTTGESSIVTETIITTNEINDAQLTSTTATIGGTFTLATVDGQPISVSEYGFCWMIGDGVPTTANYSQTVTPNNGAASCTIKSLKPNTLYSYCAYLVVQDDVIAQIVPEGASSPVETLIIPKDTIIYSPVSTFTTKPSADEDDNTGGSWGDGGETDFE